MSKGGQGLTVASGAYAGEASLFVAAAHDLKSPLALLRQLALSIEAGGLTQPEVIELAHRIALTSERALRLTTDLTCTTRLEKALFGNGPLDVATVCRDVVAEIMPLYRAKNRTITVQTRYRSVLGIANQDLLRRIVLNFVDNALHYGGVDTPVVVRLNRRLNGRVIRISVRDYGPSVPAKLWQRLQTNLGACAQPLHNRPGSSGLGLYIAGQFATAMQAQIGAIRHRDGVTFYIDLTAVHQQRLL